MEQKLIATLSIFTLALFALTKATKGVALLIQALKELNDQLRGIWTGLGRILRWAHRNIREEVAQWPDYPKVKTSFDVVFTAAGYVLFFIGAFLTTLLLLAVVVGNGADWKRLLGGLLAFALACATVAIFNIAQIDRFKLRETSRVLW
jgi:hypothetical protein